MSRLSDQLAKQGKAVPANPLPETIPEGDSSETDIHDDNDTPPGIPPKEPH